MTTRTLLEERSLICLSRSSIKARTLNSQVIEMGDMGQAFSRSEAISMPDAVVMGAHLSLAKLCLLPQRA